MHDMTIAVLAGGRSTRMGQNKSFVEVHGVPMIERVLDSVSPLGRPIMLITADSEVYAHYSLPMFADVIPHQGALGGLYTALYYSTTPYILCVACDMPFLNTDVLRYLLGHRHEANAVVAHINGLWQPFPGIYHRCLLPSLKESLDKHQSQMQRVLNHMSVYPVSSKEILHIDPGLRTFTNINNPNELEVIQRSCLGPDVS
jgi:molybdenum cofactor guanylyltransferase